ncbi:NAD(P)-dependent oxidoreductase [Streptomyces sp. NPDC050504]|uniref:NAD(P)-dependent oxidoreductase n=1 Tax=Streptomyces sp. NPDC050504 TaxID=3365618 RepID=UPI0037AF6D0D
MTTTPQKTQNTPAPVTVLGLGLMGTALAAALLKAGHPLTVWNRTESKTGPLVAQGALPARTPEEAIAASPLLIVCLTTNAAVEELLTGRDLTGKTVVNLTNGTPSQARALARRLAEQHAQYLDGGIMAVPQMIATPAAYVLYSGPQEVYEAHRTTFEAWGGTRFAGEDPGLAALFDLSLLTGMYGLFIGVAQAQALIRTEGIAAEGFTNDLLIPWVSAMLTNMAPAMAHAVDTDRHLTDVSSMEINQAAFQNFLTTYREQGVSTELFEPFQTLLDRSLERGYAADGLSRLVTLLEK